MEFKIGDTVKFIDPLRHQSYGLCVVSSANPTYVFITCDKLKRGDVINTDNLTLVDLSVFEDLGD